MTEAGGDWRTVQSGLKDLRRGADEEERASEDESKLILFALGSQATQGTQQAAAARGECKQLGWFGGGDAVETAKLTTWKNLGNLDKFEAMRLCALYTYPSAAQYKTSHNKTPATVARVGYRRSTCQGSR
jgi:hypothetical protein